MKITKPFADYRTNAGQELPLWFIEDCQLPDIDYNSLLWTDEFNSGILLNETIFKKRIMTPWDENQKNPTFISLGPIVKNIISTIRDNHPIENLEEQWPFDTWNLQNFYYIIKKDTEGFVMGPHLDNRNTKWTFIMNLEDNPNSTTFYVDGKTVQGPAQKGSGVFYFNHHELLHSIGPILRDRFTLFYMNLVK
jgi:hypothetical protein